MSKPWPAHLEIPEAWKARPEIEIVDRYGYLSQAFALLEPLRKERDQLAALIRDKFAAAPPDQGNNRLTGQKYQVIVSEQEYRREITDRDKLRRMLSARGLFDKAWDVTWDFIEKNIPEEKHPLFGEKKRTGTRDVKAIYIANFKPNCEADLVLTQMLMETGAISPIPRPAGTAATSTSPQQTTREPVA